MKHKHTTCTRYQAAKKGR